MPHSVINGLKRAIRDEGNLGGNDSRFGKDSVLFVDVDEIGDPQAGGVRQKRRKLFDMEVAGLILRKVDVTDGFEGCSHEELQSSTRGLDEGLDRYVARDVVSPGEDGRCKRRQPDNQPRN